MVDRVVSSLSAAPERMDRPGRVAGQPGSLAEFQELMRGDAGQVEDSRSGQSPALLRSNRVRQQDHGVTRPDTRKAVPGAGPASVSNPATRVRDNAASVRTPAEASATAGSEDASGLPQASATTAPAGARFVRSADTTAPHLPRFSEVPEEAKFPAGPYRQAPPESGGEWWYVSPFTGPAPWRALDAAKAPPTAALETEPVPAGFEEVFGPRPERSNRTALAQWEQDMSYFQQTGIPDGFDAAQVDAATTEFEEWGLGKPVFYEGRYGWQVRFPDSQLPSFETTAATALLVPHIVIAQHQARSIQEGATVVRHHPWLPERLLPA